MANIATPSGIQTQFVACIQVCWLISGLKILLYMYIAHVYCFNAPFKSILVALLKFLDQMKKHTAKITIIAINLVLKIF